MQSEEGWELEMATLACGRETRGATLSPLLSHMGDNISHQSPQLAGQARKKGFEAVLLHLRQPGQLAHDKLAGAC